MMTRQELETRMADVLADMKQLKIDRDQATDQDDKEIIGDTLAAYAIRYKVLRAKRDKMA